MSKPYGTGHNMKEHGEGHSFPDYISHNNRDYMKTGKIGTHRKSGEESAEYSSTNRHGESRLWQRKSGKIEMDD